MNEPPGWQESHRLPDRYLRPRIPPRHPPPLVPKQLQKPNHTPYIPPITPEPKTHADDAQFSTNARLDISQRRTVT